MVKLSKGRKSWMESHLKQRLRMVRKRNYNCWKYLYIKKYPVAPGINEYSLHGSSSKPTANNIVKMVKI